MDRYRACVLLCPLLLSTSVAAQSTSGLHRLDAQTLDMTGGFGQSLQHDLTLAAGQPTPPGESFDSSANELQWGFLHRDGAQSPIDSTLIQGVIDGLTALIDDRPPGLNTRFTGQAVDRLLLALSKLEDWQASGNPGLLNVVISQIDNALKKLDRSDPALTDYYAYLLASALRVTVLAEIGDLALVLGEGDPGIVAARGWMTVADGLIQTGEYEAALGAVKRAYSELLPLYPA